MADNDEANRFSLQEIRRSVSNDIQSFRQTVSGNSENEEELSQNAVVKSIDGSDAQDLRKPYEFEQPDYDRTEAPKDEMRKYWRQFETTPIIRKPITSFASRVTEPGYFIETTQLTKDEVEKIGKWLDQAAILEGQPGKDFRLLAKKAIVQREVRGTSLVELAPHKEDEEKIAGLKLMNPETMEAVTRPNQSILMAPDDDEKYEDAPPAESGGSAAWLQDILETDQTYFGTPISEDETGDTKIGFRRDEVIPLTRDADVGEVFGTSRIEAVSDRVDGIKQKLADNDEAIASKAYPLWLFMFGSEDEPWDSKDIQSFMQAQEMDNFHPGMKQGVRGDVGVKTISGEVADIAEYLQFDLRWIMSAMPMPMFVLGSFESASVGQVAGVAQQQDVNRQIKEARRELEEEFTPVVRQVAMQNGVDEERARDIRLKFGTPGETDLSPERNEQVIRYISNSNNGKTETVSQPKNQQPTAGNTGGMNYGRERIPEGIQPGEPMAGSIDNPTPDQDIIVDTEDIEVPTVEDSSGNPQQQAQNARWNVWNTNRSSTSLSDGDTATSEIGSIVNDVFTEVRDNTLKTVEERYAATPKYAATEFENIANRELNKTMQQKNVSRRVRSVLTETLSDVVESLGGSANQFTSGQNVKFYAQNVENAIRDATEEMLRKARLQVRRGVVENESWNTVRARVENDYNDTYLSDRASLIAEMETRNAIESTKLSEFEQSDNIVGLKISNEGASTPLIQSLSGREVYFDKTENLRSELLSGVEDKTHNGFDPLPTTPPYHFNDTTTLEPIYRSD